MAETILITGGAGTLGRATARQLVAEGSQVRLMDLQPVDDIPGADSVLGDVRDAEAVRAALDGVDGVVHAAAWHGIHLRDHPPSDFWSLNVDGTFVLYEAALAAGIAPIVLASTMGVYGESRAMGPDGAAVRIHEDLALRPVNVYELSKVVAEEVAASYHRRGVRGSALRFGMFVPEPFLHAGIRFLYGGIDERDVATAVVAALRHLPGRSEAPFAAYNIFSAVPYSAADAPEMPRDPMAVIGRHWPDAPQLLDTAGTAPWGPIHEWYDISRAERELGWAPRYGFTEFLAALREGRTSL